MYLFLLAIRNQGRLLPDSISTECGCACMCLCVLRIAGSGKGNSSPGSFRIRPQELKWVYLRVGILVLGLVPCVRLSGSLRGKPTTVRVGSCLGRGFVVDDIRHLVYPSSDQERFLNPVSLSPDPASGQGRL